MSMQFRRTKIEGGWEIQIEEFPDERGSFQRVWCAQEYEQHGLRFQPVLANSAYNHRAGTLRGLHYQEAPFSEAKLVRCIAGAVYDVILDIRPGSNTFGKWVGVELTARNKKMLFIPEGCAHGYLTLTDATEVTYQVSAPYSPEHARGVRWNDPAFDIHWPRSEDLILSARDRSWADFTSRY